MSELQKYYTLATEFDAARAADRATIAELQAKCERLEAALRDAHDWIQGFANGASRPHMDGRKVLANAKKVLAAAAEAEASVLTRR